MRAATSIGCSLGIVSFVRLGVALVAFVACAAPASAQEALPKKAEQEFRTIVTRALAAASEKELEAAVEEAATFEGKYEFADLAAALRKGPVLPKGLPKPRDGEALETFGSALSGLTFTHEGQTIRYAVDVPAGHDSSRPVGLLIDPGHGAARSEDAQGKAGYLDFFRARADAAGHRDWLIARTEIIEQIGAGGARGEQPEDQVVAAFDSFFRDVCSRFAVDLDHVYVAGLSQTGYWAWYLGAARSDRFHGVVPMGAVTWQVDAYFENFRDLPVYVLHGDSDGTCPVAQPRALTALMQRAGVPHVYDEVEGGEHNGSVWGRLDRGLKWVSSQPRPAHCKLVGKSLQTLHTPWCEWVRVDALENSGTGKAGVRPTAGIDAEIEGQTVNVRSDGVGALRVYLAPGLLDLAQPVAVVWNGETAHEGKVVRSVREMVRSAAERTDWRRVYEAVVTLRK